MSDIRLDTPPSPPPPPRREPEAPQAPGEPRPPEPPGELWGVYRHPDKNFPSGGWVAEFFNDGAGPIALYTQAICAKGRAHWMARQIRQSVYQDYNAGPQEDELVPANVEVRLIGVSPAVREQRDRLRRTLERLTRVAKQVERFLIESRNPNALDIFQTLNLETTVARAVLTEIEGGGGWGPTKENRAMADEPEMIDELKDLVGKTIAHAAVLSAISDERIGLVFTDGTAARFNIERGWDGDADVVLDSDPLYDDDLLALGFIDKAEYDRREQERNRQNKAEREAEREASDRAEYARLKAKFEGNPNV